MKKPKLYIVIPCYNEEEVLPLTLPVFLDKITKLSESGMIADDSRILLVDDGSKDNTWKVISEFCDNSMVEGLSLSRNFGHQNALVAGLMEAKDKCDITISMDCDGQDDINAIDCMLNEYASGSEIVYGVRDDRSSDSILKRTTAHGFYKFMNLMGAESVYDHADYRLVSAKVLNSFADYNEVNLFLRGIFSIIGFKSSCVKYTRSERVAGKTHYSPGRMIGLAIQGITDFSVRPLRLISFVGAVISLIALGFILYSVIQYFLGNVVAGWASTMVTVAFIGGIQMLCLGVIGEYIGKIYSEVKHRPRYIIKERIEKNTEE